MSESIINRTAYETVPEQPVSPFDKGKISLRRQPYPYRAGLAICSDIDDTETTEEFLEIQRFLNTKHVTSMGEGIGLEIGNSFYFYDDEGYFSYFTHDEHARRVIIDLIRAGYIDCMHTYGDAAISRDEILRALDVLHKEDCKLDVWVNHFGARNCFSRKFEYMFGECRGDDPGSNVYHADVTLNYGIRFVWVGAMTRVIGQSPTSNVLSSLCTAFDPRYPLRSWFHIGKEIGKRALGQLGDERFIIHRFDQLTRVMQLEDGRKAHEFIRYCNHPAGIPQGGTSHGLSYVISSRALERLKAVQGFMVVYTHFGQNSSCQQVIPPETQEALRNLARECQYGKIYVTTTSKLLNYHHASQYLAWSYQQTKGCTQIHIDHLDDPVFGKIPPTIEQLQGLTFYVPDSSKVEIYVGGVEVEDIQHNPADYCGMESVMIPLIHLSFPY